MIKPGVVGGLALARAKYQALHGEIVTDWRIENGTLTLDVTVPPGTAATVYVPGDGPVQVTPRSSLVKAAGAGNGRTVLEVGPGRYSFQAGAPGRHPV